MKKEMTSFDILVMAAELQRLKGSYVDKVYQSETNVLHFRFNIPGEGKENLIVEVGRWMYLNPSAEPPGKALAYGMFLRKYLINARVKSIEQRGFDRIVQIVLDRRGEFRLILEMFGKGNVILAKDDIILQPLHSRSWSRRELRAHKDYVFPPERTNAPSLAPAKISSVIRSSDKDTVRALAVDLNLGGVYAEELCHRASIDKSKPAGELDEGEIGNLLAHFRDLLNEMATPSPTLVFENDVLIDVVPIRLRKYEDLRLESTDTFSEALVRYLEVQPEEFVDEPTGRLQRRMKQQEEALGKYKEQALTSHELAEFIYTHFQAVDKALRAIREEEELADIRVLAKDPKSKTARIRIEETEIEVSYEKDVNTNAQMYYQKEKTAKAKTESLKKAMQDTEKEILQAQKRVKKADVRTPTKTLWMDRYRWFISSEGYLVLGGKDAKSNERVVKKHLDSGDRYIHAEISGAPSVVVKKGSEAGEETLREACQFALCFSKAWSKGLASGSAYWVTPEQVSRRAESGEFLPRGGFVVRGKRNYFHKLPLEVAVVELEYEGVRKVVCGPPDAFPNRSQMRYLLRPGKGDPNEVARKLSNEYNVPIEEIQRILPPGSLEVI